MKLLKIPNYNYLKEDLKLKEKLNIGFEYNDFFSPNLLDDEAKLNERIEAYKDIDGFNTLHGAFFDICLNSCDKLIRDASIKRVKQTLDIATKLNCKKIIFHTNYIVGFNVPRYKTIWAKENAKEYIKLLNEYDITFCIENMFDESYEMILSLLEEVNHPRFQMCLDVAHANLSNKSIDEWFDKCAKYITHIHLNDNNSDFDSHLAIGKGNIDYKNVIKRINSLKDISVLIEVNSTEDFLESYEYLKKEGLNI